MVIDMINDITSAGLMQFNPTLRGRSDAHVENQVSKPSHGTALTNEASQRILNDSIIEKLDKVLQKNGAESVRTLDHANYTPDAVSKRILSYVQDAINRAGARGENQQKMLEQAKAGINQGFKEAENILTSLNALSGAIAENVKKTYELIQNGMSEVVNKLQNYNAENPQTNFSSSFTERSHSVSQSLDLEIQTREGDTLKVSLSRNEHTGEYTAHVKRPNGEAAAYEKTYELSSNFSMQVAGDLDADELVAIEEVLVGVQGVANEFFNGNAESALEMGMNLGYDSSEIAAFSLSLNENQNSRVTRAYEEVSQIGGGSGTNHDALVNLLKPVQGFMNSFGKTLGKAEASGMFNDAKSNIINLLEYFGKSDKQHASALDSLEAKAGAPFQNIANDLLSQL